jgi:hypothetical protein
MVVRVHIAGWAYLISRKKALDSVDLSMHQFVAVLVLFCVILRDQVDLIP